MSDPREQYSNLIEDTVTEQVDTATFDALADNEAFNAGWVVATVVLDDDDRILLAYHEDDGSWLLPGGSVIPGEDLAETAIREAKEETGVEIVPQRPYAVVQNRVECNGRTRSFNVVLFSASPTSPEIGEDLGEPGEPITDAEWFTTLPSNVFERDLAQRVVERVQSTK
ncbi:NUDIX hydrolase [Haladaptatus halobius]|uniref:NUDIX hydrolase n=1 Tax=Haladaptatus halobius TaxID=2884875 RepID=UPI001D0B7EF0|nr:NUDIX hydrolase [Haladaptatus halobius]